VNGPLLLAGSLALLASAIHGGAGEMLVVRRLSVDSLPATRLGGPRMTRAMIHVSWHLVTAAFLAAGVAMLVSGSALDGDVARGVGIAAAAAFTGFAAVAIGLGLAGAGSLRAMSKHLGPALIALTAATAWWGVLSL
jgi:hypothetical protein